MKSRQFAILLFFPLLVMQARTREGIEKRKIKMKGRGEKIKILWQPVMPSVARYRMTSCINVSAFMQMAEG